MSLPSDSKARKEIPLYSGLVKYFPNALIEVARTSWVGNEQHHPGTPLHWDRAKSTDEADALLRHLFDDAMGVPMDGDIPHLAKVAWRALAMLQKACEASENIPKTLSATTPLPEPGPVVPVSSEPEIGRIPPPVDADE